MVAAASSQSSASTAVSAKTPAVPPVWLRPAADHAADENAEELQARIKPIAVPLASGGAALVMSEGRLASITLKPEKKSVSAASRTYKLPAPK